MNSPVCELPKTEVSLILEVHFHEQEKASVFLESNTSGPANSFGEVFLFTLFALRQLASLGQPESAALAAALLDVDSIMEDFAGGYDLAGVKIVGYPGYRGRKVLVARFTLRQESHSFYFNTKGFGLLSRGVGYYCPTGVFVLLRYLAMHHASEEEYLAKLAQAAALCGAFYAKGQISMWNQSQVAFMIAGTVLVVACQAESPRERAHALDTLWGAYAQYKRGDSAAGLRGVEAALAIDPDLAYANIVRAEIALGQEDWPSAQSYFERGLRLLKEPNQPLSPVGSVKVTARQVEGDSRCLLGYVYIKLAQQANQRGNTAGERRLLSLAQSNLTESLALGPSQETRGMAEDLLRSFR